MTAIKKTGRLAGIGAFVLALANVAGIASAQEEFELKFADWMPTSHPTPIYGAQHFIEKAQELSDGALTITYYPVEQLGKASNMLRLIQTGVADISNIAPAYMTEKLPLSGVGELPNLFESACEGSLAIHEMSQPGGFLYENEIVRNDFRVLFVANYGAYRALSASRVVESAEDFEGMKFRTAGGAMDMTAKAIGAVSVRIPGPDALISLQRGTLDGGFTPLHSVRPFGMHEVITSYTPNVSVGSFTLFYGISERTWQSMPEKIQNALIEAGRMATENHCANLDATEQEAAKSLEEEDGIKAVALPEADVSALNEKLVGVQKGWAEALDGRGQPGTQVLEILREVMETARK
jgi:TRAP-type C4-dicarboxylate transport system substrate-binding protein